MKPNTLSLLLAAIALLSSSVSLAQQDSSLIHLANTSIDKRFTQHVTITAADLERVPFASLAEIINTYFYGTYTHSGQIVYLVDGNPMDNPDAIAIQDIAQLTLIQNAQTFVNGADGSRQFIAITTKTGTSTTNEIIVHGSSYKISMANRDGLSSGTNRPTFFHQYHLRASRVLEKQRFGASINYLHEAFNVHSAEEIVTAKPAQLDRLRMNAWLTTNLGKSSVITLRVVVAPQDTARSITIEEFGFRKGFSNSSSHLTAYPSVQLNTRLSEKWSNHVSGSYEFLEGKNRLNEIEVDLSQETQWGKSYISARSKSNRLFVKDRIAFLSQKNGWSLNPALTISYEQSKFLSSSKSRRTSSSWPAQMAESRLKLKQADWLLTPTIAIAYRDIFYVNGGLQTMLANSSVSVDNKNKPAPFVSITADVFELINRGSTSSLKLFASHSSNSTKFDDPMRRGMVVYGYSSVRAGSVPLYDDSPGNQRSNYTQFGGSLGFNNERFYVGYNFFSGKYEQRLYYYMPGSIGPEGVHVQFGNVNIKTQRATVGYNHQSDKARFALRTALSLNHVKSELTFDPWMLWPEMFASEYPQNGWSAGFTNHLRVSKFVAGVSALSLFRDEHTSLLLQNVYAGFELSIGKRPAELYISTRNLLQNDDSMIYGGNIRYHGVGGKIKL